ncbi:unnamed protein product [marine sediment metagenome]|uniref:Uncharacterized protein n=1 Tax=marine sediment metagenome TaxID=412755 RepID=X0ZZG9_9ZZZZ
MDYGEIIRRAWNITKKYKYLWVFGFILALFGGGGGYSSNNLSNSFQYTYKRSEIALPVELQQFLSRLQYFVVNNVGLIILFAIFMIILAIAGFILYIIAVCLKFLKINLNEFLIDSIIPLFFITINLEE